MRAAQDVVDHAQHRAQAAPYMHLRMKHAEPSPAQLEAPPAERLLSCGGKFRVKLHTELDGRVQPRVLCLVMVMGGTLLPCEDAAHPRRGDVRQQVDATSAGREGRVPNAKPVQCASRILINPETGSKPSNL